MDDKKLEELLEKNNALVTENNVFLHKIYKHIQWGRFFKIFYWVIVIGSILGVFYFLQPIIDAVLGSYNETVGPFKNLGQ